jgi:hypothetical protein
MKADDPWILLRAQMVNEGLKALQKVLDTKQSPSHIMEMGVAYMWVGHFAVAKDHFETGIAKCHGNMSSFYGMAGTAKWCLGEFEKAVETWRHGLAADFSDTAGLGVRLPLLLWFASIVKPETYNTNSATSLLKDKCSDLRIKEWPGPLARFILGDNDESELPIQGKHDGIDESANRLWETEFYKAVGQLARGRSYEYQSTLLKLTDTKEPDWSNDDFFLARVWSEEFFLARSCANGNRE